MKKNYLSVLFLISFCFVIFQCDDDDTSTFEKDQAELNTLKSQIEDLARTSICNETNKCQFIGLGNKACGGPQSYLVYSSSIDTDYLENLVENYNQKEKAFNIKWEVVSDCAVTNPPSSVNCENNICVAVY